PADVRRLGLAAEGVGGVITAFLYGIGRPGLNSIAMASGVVVTVALDLILIPSFGAVGAAVASSAAYVSSTMALVLLFRHLARSSNRSPGDSLAAQPRVEV